MNQYLVKTLSAFLVFALHVLYVQPATAASPAPPVHVHVSLGVDKKSTYLSWVAPENSSLDKAALAVVEVKANDGPWQTKVKLPWWQSVINISKWNLNHGLARVFYISKLKKSAVSQEVDLSTPRQLMENFRNTQSNFFSTEVSPKTLTLNVSWLKPNFVENWDEYAQSPVFLQASISYPREKLTYNLPINAPYIRLKIRQTDLKSKFLVTVRFTYQNGVVEKLSRTVTHVSTSVAPSKPFVFSKIFFGSIFVDTCVLYAMAADSLGRNRNSSPAATFKVQSDSGENFTAVDTLDLRNKTGVYQIEAKVSYGGKTKVATTMISADAKLGFCETYVAPKEPSSPPEPPVKPKLNMPVKLTWPAIVNSTAIESYRLSIETRVPLSGFVCRIQVGSSDRTVSLDKYGLGSLLFTGQELFFLPEGRPGSISGSCENAKYRGALPTLTMKKTEFPGSSWYLIQSG